MRKALKKKMLSISKGTPRVTFSTLRSFPSCRQYPVKTSSLTQRAHNSTSTPNNIPHQSPRERIDEYFTYFKTQATLRPLVYRAKNANTLIAMDLIDPETNQPITPKKPIVSIPNKLLIDYLKSVSTEGSNEFYEWFKKWTDVTPRKKPIWNYFTPVHLQYMMIQSFYKIGDYTRLIGFLYTRWDRFLRAGNSKIFDTEHFFNTYLMCAIQRAKIFEFSDAEMSKKKMLQAWSRTCVKEQRTGLCGVLVNCFAKQQGFSLDKESEAERELAELSAKAVDENGGGVVLPKFDSEMMGDPQKFLERNEGLYLICRTLMDSLNPDTAATVIAAESYSEIQRFVDEYNKLSAANVASGSGFEGIYESYMESMRKIWTAKKEQAMQREGKQEKTEGAEAGSERD